MNRFSVFFCLIIWLITASILNPKAEAASIRIGVLPILESLPFIVVQERGLFHSSGLKVEVIFSRSMESEWLRETPNTERAIPSINTAIC